MATTINIKNAAFLKAMSRKYNLKRLLFAGEYCVRCTNTYIAAPPEQYVYLYISMCIYCGATPA